MIETIINYQGSSYRIDISSPIDLSIPIGRQAGPNAFYLSQPDYETVEAGGFIGNVHRGGSCNVENIFFSPHGNGTHTECAGHVSEEPIYINDVLKNFFFLARLISVQPELNETGHCVTARQLSAVMQSNLEGAESVIIRTLPNDEGKRTFNYSGANAPYIHRDAVAYLNEIGIKHLLTDLPSLDKEDDANLSAHKVFFKPDGQWAKDKTVTEMIYASDKVPDGLYWLNLQIVSFESDASPSKPILYAIMVEK